MDRLVLPEILDALPPDHKLAIGSRRDLRRLNKSMRSALLIAQELRAAFPGNPPLRIAELGAGDGSLMLSVARMLPTWKGVRIDLLDQQNVVDEKTRKDYVKVGWHTRPVQSDVFRWLQAGEDAYDVMIANLFLHHFTRTQLREVFAQAASRTDVFVALEPRRCTKFLIVSHLLWLLGCNRVTRHDARVSVRAGFNGAELTELWPAENWEVQERPAGWFSHLFLAKLKSE